MKDGFYPNPCWRRDEVDLQQIFMKDGQRFLVIGIADEPTVLIKNLETKERHHYVISSLLFSEFRKVGSARCANDVDGTCVLPTDLRTAIAVDTGFMWTIIEATIDLLKRIHHIKDLSNEEAERIYGIFRGILTRGKTDGGCGYCDDCANKAIEYFAWAEE